MRSRSGGPSACAAADVWVKAWRLCAMERKAGRLWEGSSQPDTRPPGTHGRAGDTHERRVQAACCKCARCNKSCTKAGT
eukprot:6086403-Prymnesium_polylepis.1